MLQFNIIYNSIYTLCTSAVQVVNKDLTPGGVFNQQDTQEIAQIRSFIPSDKNSHDQYRRHPFCKRNNNKSLHRIQTGRPRLKYSVTFLTSERFSFKYSQSNTD